MCYLLVLIPYSLVSSPSFVCAHALFCFIPHMLAFVLLFEVVVRTLFLDNIKVYLVGYKIVISTRQPLCINLCALLLSLYVGILFSLY